MKLLSFESSAVSAAVCLTDGEKVVASAFQNCGLTHSRTLLPMAEQLLSNVGLTPRSWTASPLHPDRVRSPAFVSVWQRSRVLRWAPACPAWACPRSRRWLGT